MTKEQHEKLEKFAEYVVQYNDLCEKRKNIGLLKQNLEKDSEFYKLNLSQNDLQETITKKVNEIEVNLNSLRCSLKDVIKTESTPEQIQQKKILKKKMRNLTLKFIPTCALALVPVVSTATIGGLVLNTFGTAPIGILAGTFFGSIISGVSIGCATHPQNNFEKFIAAPSKPFINNFIEICNCQEEIKNLDYKILTHIANENLSQNITTIQKEETTSEKHSANIKESISNQLFEK